MIRKLALITALLLPALAHGANYVTEVLADSPINFWYLDEPSGVTATDHGLGTLHDMAYVAAPTLGALGKVSGHTAVTFNGSTQYAQTGGLIPSVEYAPSLHDFTWECWANPSSVAAAGTMIQSVESSGGSCGAAIFRNWALFAPHSGASGKAQMYIADNTGCGTYMSVTGTTVLLTSTWYQIVGRYRRSSPLVEISVNGVPESSSSSASGSPATGNDGARLRIAAFTGNSDAPVNLFPGSMQMCSIFQARLSDARVLAHYNAGINPSSGGLPFIVRHFERPHRIAPRLVGFSMPSLAVDAPGFIIDRLNGAAKGH